MTINNIPPKSFIYHYLNGMVIDYITQIININYSGWLFKIPVKDKVFVDSLKTKKQNIINATKFWNSLIQHLDLESKIKLMKLNE